MKEILEKYSTRLVNVSGRNRSFVMKKLYKKRAFDLTRLDEFTEDISEDIIKLLLSRGKEEVNISKDPYDWYKENLKELKREHMYFILNFCSKIQLKILPCKHE